MKCRVEGHEYEFDMTWKQWKAIGSASTEVDAITAADDVLKNVKVDGAKPKGGADALDAQTVLKLVERMGNPTKTDEDAAPLAEKPTPVEAATK